MPNSIAGGGGDSQAGVKLTPAMLYVLALNAGFTDGLQCWEAVAIARAESGGCATARNPANYPAGVCLAKPNGKDSPTQAGGYVARGLWQIRNQLKEDEAIRQGYYDPANNASRAFSVWKAGGFGRWQSYTSGSYKKFMPADTSPLAAANPSLFDRAKTLLGLTASAEKTIASNVLGNLDPVGRVIAFITGLGATIGVSVAALMLFIVGAIFFLSKTKAGKAAANLAVTAGAPELKAATLVKGGKTAVSKVAAAGAAGSGKHRA